MAFLKHRIPASRLKRIGLALVMFIVLVAGAMLLFRHSRDDGYGGRTATVTHSVTTPSETKPDSAAYTVPADQPLSIEIAGRDIKGNIQKVGRDQDAAVTAPNNVHLAGWFTDSVLPGKPGLSIIDGHVDGTTQPGVFHNLRSVKTGDRVIVTFGNGSQKMFEVLSARQVAADQAAQLLFSQDPGVASQLNIVTCAGTYKREKGGYDQRIIVAAKSLH